MTTRYFHVVVLSLVLLSSFVLKLNHLGHAAIHTPDEVIDAVISQNLLKHPLVPTLIDKPYLGYDDTDWQSSHVWLFKPPVTFWQIATMFALFGQNTLSLRIMSVILSTIAVWMTYEIGKLWLDRDAGLIAAALQAFCPATYALVHGYQFSDHIDITLLLWCEVSIYFLARAIRNGGRRDLILAGVAQGLAFLSKWHLALFVLGLAVTAWVLPKTQLAKSEERRLSGKGLLIFIASFVATILPWLLYIGIGFPQQLWYTNMFVFRHLNEDMSSWAAPWDRLMFDYAIQIFHVFSPAVLAAVVWALARAWQQKNAGLWMTLAWVIGVFLPNILALTKTPPSTLTAWPACWLLLGYLISSALKNDRWALGIWTIAMVLAVALIGNESIPSKGMGFGPYFGAIFREHIWVLWHVLAALGIGVLVAKLSKSPKAARGMIVVSTVAMVLLGFRWWGGSARGYIVMAWKVTDLNVQKPDFSPLGQFARQLPDSAVFLVDEQSRSETRLMQFAADRTCYPMSKDDWKPQARALIAAGTLPYLVTSQPRSDLPAIFTDPVLNRTIYACTEAAKNAAQRQRPPDVMSPG